MEKLPVGNDNPSKSICAQYTVIDPPMRIKSELTHGYEKIVDEGIKALEAGVSAELAMNDSGFCDLMDTPPKGRTPHDLDSTEELDMSRPVDYSLYDRRRINFFAHALRFKTELVPIPEEPFCFECTPLFNVKKVKKVDKKL